jgi:hypothetical protein
VSEILAETLESDNIIPEGDEFDAQALASKGASEERDLCALPGSIDSGKADKKRQAGS